MPSTSLEIQDRDSGRRFRTDEVTPRHQKRPGFRVLFRLSWTSLDLLDLVLDLPVALTAENITPRFNFPKASRHGQ
jgi:hypothetical protein